MIWIALTILIIVLVMQLIVAKARLKKVGFLVLAASALAIFGWAGYQAFQQYHLWKNNEVSQFLLPPYQSWDYFVFYARTRFFNPYLLSLLIGLVFLWAAKMLNKKYQERFFEPIEPYLLAMSIFLVGHPLWLFYLIILLFLFLIINFALSTFHFWLNKEMPRISLYYFWLPAAIFTIIIISRWISSLLWWNLLKL